MTARTPPYPGRLPHARSRSPARATGTGAMGNPWEGAVADRMDPPATPMTLSAWRQAHQRRAVAKAPGMALAVLAVLATSINFLYEDQSREFDSQVAVHFTGYLLAALSVLFAIGRRKLHLTLSLGAWALVPLYFAVSALYAPQPMFALAAGLANVVILLFCWRQVHRLGPERSVLMLIIAGAVMACLSIIAFYAFPDLGQTTGDIFGEEGGRMSGIASAANTLGAISALTILFSVMYFQRFTQRQRIIAAVAIPFAVWALIGSVSRTSIIALILCLGLWWLCRGGAARNLLGAALIGLTACIAIIMKPDWVALMSRSNSAEDLATFNGRSEVWTVAWENIFQHKIFGQGFGSSRVVLQNDDRLYSAAVHTHNLYLELLFSGGLIAFGLFVLAFGMTVLGTVRQPRPAPLVALMFFVLVGATEATPFAGFPQYESFAFFTAVALCLAGSKRRRKVRTGWAARVAPRPLFPR